MMKRYWLAGLAAVLLLVVFVVALAPARLLPKLAQQLDLPLQAWSVQGTIWHGDMQQVQVAGEAVQQVQWQLHPMRLLGAELCTSLLAKTRDVFASGDVCTDGEQRFDVTDGVVNLNLKSVLKRAGIPVMADGDLQVDIASLHWSGDAMAQLSGKAKLNKLVLNFNGRWIDVGNYDAVLSLTDDGALLLDIPASDSRVVSVGTVKVYPDGRYFIDLTMTPSSDAAPELSNNLQYMAKHDGKGNYHLKFNSKF